MLLEELLVKVAADISSYTQGMDAVVGKTAAVEGAVDRTASSMDRVMSGLESMGSSLTRVGTTLTAAITLPLAGVSIAALKMSSDLQQATIAFGTLMGSATKAQEHLDALRTFALKSPFEFNDLVQASKKLQALGFTAQQVIPTLTAIGDAAAALGGGAQTIDRISLALGQMQAKTKVTAEEMRQLTDAGIKGWDILAEAISKQQGKIVTVGEVMKLSEKGMIDGGAAVQALLEGMEKKFKGLQEAQMSTIGGMFSNLKDQSAKVLTEIGDMLTPLGKKVIEFASGGLAAVQHMTSEFQTLPVAIQGITAAFVALAAAAGPALLVTGQLAQAIVSIGKITSALSLASGGSASLVALAGSIGLVATAILGLAAAREKLFLLGQSDNGKISGLAGGINAGLAAIGLPMFPSQDMGASEQDKIDAWRKAHLSGQTFGTPGLGKLGNLIKKDPGQESKDAATALSSAFSTFGQYDLVANAKALEDAYNLLAKSGRATTDQLADDWAKVLVAQDAVRASAVKFTGYYDQAKPFDVDSLPKLNNVAQQITKGVVDHEKNRGIEDVERDIKNATAAQIKLNDEAANFAKLGPEMLDAYNELLQNLREDSSEAGIFAGNLKLTAAEMQSVNAAAAELDKQLASTLANPFAVMTGSTEKFIESLERGVGAAKSMELGAGELDVALRTLGVSTRDDVSRIDEAWSTVQDRFAKGRIGVEELNKSFIGYIQTLDKAGVAIQDGLIAPYLKAMDVLSNARSKLHFAEEIKGEVSGAFQGIEAAIGQNLFEWDKWAGSIKNVAKNLVGDLATTFLHGLFKPLEQQFSTMVASWGTKIASSLGIFGPVGGGLAGAGPIAGGVAGGLDSALGIGSSAASAVPSVASTAGTAVSTATSTVMGAVGAIGSAVSAISSVIGNFQFAGMNKSLDVIVKQTLGILNEALNMRRDVWDQHNGLIAKFDMLFDRLGDFWHDVVERLDNTYTRLGEMLGSFTGGMQTNADGSVTASSVFFADLIDAVREGAKSVVDAVVTAADRITGVITAPPAEVTPSPEVTPAPETQPYSNGIPYDSTITKVTIPADQNTVNTLLLLNDTVTKGFAATIAQLQSMAGIGGGTGTSTTTTTIDDPATLELMDTLKQQGVTVTTPTAGLSAEELQGAVNQIMLNLSPAASQKSSFATITKDSFAGGVLTGAAGIAALQAEVRGAMDAGDTALANYYQQWIDAMQAPADAVTSHLAGMSADSTAAGTLTGAAGLAELQRQAKIAMGAGDLATALSYQKFMSMADQAPASGPSTGMMGEGRWNGNAWVPMESTIKPPEWQNPNDYNGSWNPLVTQNMQSARNITISNNTFRSRDDLNYLRDLVINQL